MSADRTIDSYCVFGNPIAHSLSPQIHTLFARQTREQLVYQKQLVEINKFKEAVKTFFQAGGKGLNITVPFKQEAWSLADILTQRAELAGAVNTLWQNEKGQLCGDNTDGAGLVSDIVQRKQWPLKNKNILLLGAGGAARGVILPLLSTEPATLVIANRTLSKAQELQTIFQSHANRQGGNIRVATFAELPERGFDLIINATSASLNAELPAVSPAILDNHTAVYDMVYASEVTAFLRWCKQHGVTKLADGLGMLVGQAAESFSIWRGVLPEVEPVMRALRTN